MSACKNAECSKRESDREGLISSRFEEGIDAKGEAGRTAVMDVEGDRLVEMHASKGRTDAVQEVILCIRIRKISVYQMSDLQRMW